MKKDEEYEKHFRNAYSNYAPILALDSELGEKLEKADEGLSFPDAPQDVLEYLGNIEPLELSDKDKAIVRQWVQRDVNEKGAKHVWKYRYKAKLEIYYIVHCMGMDIFYE
jgi:hypothetical protein